jgi:hypothetical protein
MEEIQQLHSFNFGVGRKVIHCQGLFEKACDCDWKEEEEEQSQRTFELGIEREEERA